MQTKEIKIKIQSVSNLKKITRAMEMVARSKMKKAVDHVEQTRPYALEALRILSHVSNNSETKHILLDSGSREQIANGNVLLVYIAAERGLCGGYNILSGRKLNSFLKEQNGSVDVIAVGKYARIYSEKAGLSVKASYSLQADNNESESLLPVTEKVLELFTEGEYARVAVLYTNYISAFSQETKIVEVLPLSPDLLLQQIEDVARNIALDKKRGADMAVVSEESGSSEYLFEPNEEEVLETIIPSLVHIFMVQTFLEAQASEQSARMVAMKNATENADNLGKELTLEYNRARQASVTAEILEIAAGADAVNT